MRSHFAYQTRAGDRYLLSFADCADLYAFLNFHRDAQPVTLIRLTPKEQLSLIWHSRTRWCPDSKIRYEECKVME